MAENGGPSTDEIVDDEDDKYNYYECKYHLFTSHPSANHFWYARNIKLKNVNQIVRFSVYIECFY